MSKHCLHLLAHVEMGKVLVQVCVCQHATRRLLRHAACARPLVCPCGAATRAQGSDGSYGTSLALGTALDPGCDVMLAYKQNGRRLAPDHVRTLLPACSGARPRAHHVACLFWRAPSCSSADAA